MSELATGQDWEQRLNQAEQHIVNVAYGWWTETDEDGRARQATRLAEAVRDHHAILSEGSEIRSRLLGAFGQARIFTALWDHIGQMITRVQERTRGK